LTEEKNRVRIIGGVSWHRTVKVLSEDFASSATFDPDMWAITVTVRRRSRMMSGGKYVPLVVRLFRSFWAMGGTAGKVLMTFYVLSMCLPLVLRGPTAPTAVHQHLSGILWELGFMVAFGLLTRHYIATWHASEHMLIRTYTDHGTTDLETARKASRIDPFCGGRFIVPLIVIPHLSQAIGYWLGIDSTILYFLFLEATLRIDRAYGLYRVPLVSHASEALQRYVTTKDPGDIELMTAQCAVDALVEEHGKEAVPA